ncbi:ComF family protein [Aquibacillus koreensis]|uniref:ComF family protein n=1 Tax=Aquibacillus koreensis TaxID=279446 RepID=A0A9X3WNU4_9BACI|nr:ComF family protein [Aquibacillus koreensis]MCT2537248.1 ComF family protein [Aquibacillus koreensis]MDC3421596.1 ComF family protein [Aquibacillus koreensis]
MHCLWCHQEMIPAIEWGNFFLPDKPKFGCDWCLGQLEVLDGELCKECGRREEAEVCSDCRRWNASSEWKGVLSFNKSVFGYNDMMKEVIAKWKYRGDYALCDLFREDFVRTFNELFKDVKGAKVVPIPLSKERLYERGFNQAEALAGFLDMPSENVLSRIHGEKQSKKTRRDRLMASNPFTLTVGITDPVILIDDIYTTGITLRHAAKLLKEAGCPEVYAFTLARG